AGATVESITAGGARTMSTGVIPSWSLAEWHLVLRVPELRSDIRDPVTLMKAVRKNAHDAPPVAGTMRISHVWWTMAESVRRSRGIAAGVARTWRARVDGCNLSLVSARPIRAGFGFCAGVVRVARVCGALALAACRFRARRTAGLSRLVVSGAGRRRFVLPAGRHLQRAFLCAPQSGS